MKSKTIIGIIVAIIIIIGGIFVFTSKQPVSTPVSSSGKVIQIVAAENFGVALFLNLGALM